MKFAKVLQQSQEELPELNSMFLRYKVRAEGCCADALHMQ